MIWRKSSSSSFSIEPCTLSRAWYTGTVPMGTGEASMMAVRTSSRLTPPVERSLTVSAPYFTASFSFFTSSAASEAFGEAPMLAFTLHLLAMPIAIGSKLAWLIFAGMIMRPLATSSMISDSGRFSRLATWIISSVISP